MHANVWGHIGGWVFREGSAHVRSISEISSCFFGPRLWHIEIRHRVKKAFTMNLFGFETLELRIRRLKLWKPTVWKLRLPTSVLFICIIIFIHYFSVHYYIHLYYSFILLLIYIIIIIIIIIISFDFAESPLRPRSPLARTARRTSRRPRPPTANEETRQYNM